MEFKAPKKTIEGCHEIRCAASDGFPLNLPLAIDLETRNTQLTIPLGSEDRFFVYTDSVIQFGRLIGKMAGNVLVGISGVFFSLETLVPMLTVFIVSTFPATMPFPVIIGADCCRQQHE